MMQRGQSLSVKFHPPMKRESDMVRLAVDIRAEVMDALTDYAREHRIPVATALKELLASALGVENGVVGR